MIMQAFCTYPERGLCGIVLGSCHNLKESFAMSRALNVLQMKKDVLKFLTAGTHLSDTNLDFQVNGTEHLQQEK